ncbi:MAG: TIM barrel protein [Bacteroidota bacterium]
MNRKQALRTLAASTGVFISPLSSQSTVTDTWSKARLKGNVNHSACRWCYSKIPLETLAQFGKEIGLKSIELLEPEEYTTVTDLGLTCAMPNGSMIGIPNGFNNPDNHDQLKKDFLKRLPMAADYGFTKMICFSGNHWKKSYKKGVDYCAKGLEPVLAEAAKYNITICMELLNSKVDHAGYQCDSTEWGVQLAQTLGMDNFKLLYDIYHMQIMEGDVIATIRKYSNYIGHYHTGGVPGRHEINETQELNYPAIMQAILDTGYRGFVGQEFIPTANNPLESLKMGVITCDV